MGSNSSKPRPLPVLALAAALPPTYIQFLRTFEELVSTQISPKLTAILGTGLKAYGCPLYVVGHLLQCQSKGSILFPDYCFITAASSLSAAFMGTHKGYPMPLAVVLCGLSLLPIYIPAYLNGKKAGVSVAAPLLGITAAILLSWVGSIQKLLSKKIIKECPGFSVGQYAQMASCCFGAANLIRILQLFAQKEPMNAMLKGQILKCLASCMLISGNAFQLGWQKSTLPPSGWSKATVLSAMALLVCGLP